MPAGESPAPTRHVDASAEGASMETLVARLRQARAAVGQVVIGQDEVIDQVVVSILGGGHVLLEGAPGLGKTLLVRTLAAALGLRSSRIQFTPDLMPGDITGNLTLVHDEAGQASLRFAPGPVFAELLLADEINRATPKTQSALLEAMQEGTVTVAGQAHALPRPFLVLATQNPIEMEGTYVLPEAQVDRFFFKVTVPYPSQTRLAEVLTRTTAAPLPLPDAFLGPAELLALQAMAKEVPAPSHLIDAVAAFAVDTQAQRSAGRSSGLGRVLRLGLSPRAAQTLVLAAKARALLDGRYAVAADDLLAVASPALRHRLQPSFEAEADGTDVEAMVLDALRRRLA